MLVLHICYISTCLCRSPVAEGAMMHWIQYVLYSAQALHAQSPVGVDQPSCVTVLEIRKEHLGEMFVDDAGEHLEFFLECLLPGRGS